MANCKNLPKGIIVFSVIEILIGLITLIAVTHSLIFGYNIKPLNVLAFVYVTSALSFALGIGLCTRNQTAYELLLFLAGTVIISKVLIVTGIIELNGALETTITPTIKDMISMVYHCVLWVYLCEPRIKAIYKKS